ncbi:hypothetical protein J3R30DRAFT_3407604 [Lentinula aciculospora]|uniref:Uncharacterized protein n=1 Tax=Lentinula aciculospora TaxID=153920 RepID=A0A9W9A165_9AGAR|nr:hypothetical protein J3R30DRAFT_3407604 [Lentinula aciculospora]
MIEMRWNFGGDGIRIRRSWSLTEKTGEQKKTDDHEIESMEWKSVEATLLQTPWHPMLKCPRRFTRVKSSDGSSHRRLEHLEELRPANEERHNQIERIRSKFKNYVPLVASTYILMVISTIARGQ